MSLNHTTADGYSTLATEARKRVLKMVHEAGTSHIASNFSVLDIATVLYENLKPEDSVVWSAGWKAATIYYFLAKQGIIPESDLDRFAKEENGKIEYLGLAETNVPGVFVNGGSMGHGLGVAVGMALARKQLNKPGTIYCILSDGELQEGSTWEAFFQAAHSNLDNLIVIIDRNKWCAMGRTNEVINVPRLRAVLRNIGFACGEVDGHDYRALEGWIKRRKFGQPACMIANTIKGKGVSFMENHLLYHYKHVDEENYNKALEELNNG